MNQLNKDIKQLREDIIEFVVDKSVDLGLDAARKAKDKTIEVIKKQDYTSIKLSIQDIINDALWRHKAKTQECNNLKDDIQYYVCKKSVAYMQIKELQKSVGNCRRNENPALCRTRVLEKIVEKKNFILKCEQQINEIKVENLKLDNARTPGKTYWGNEYKSLDD